MKKIKDFLPLKSPWSFKMNKKSEGEKVMYIYWFLIIIIISIAVVSAVVHVFGSAIDIREAEASLLKDKAIDCLVNKGELISGNYNALKSGDDSSLLQTCKISLADNTGSYKDSKQYGLKINDKEFGDNGLFDFCGIENSDVRCDEAVIYVLDFGSEKFLSIKSVVRKKEKN